MTPKLSPITKIFLTSSLIALAFICRDLHYMIVISLIGLGIVGFLSREALSKYIKMVVPMIIVALITWTLFRGYSIFYSGGEGIDIYFGLFMATRLSAILASSFIFMLLLKPLELITALRLLRLPPKVVLIAGLTFRHISTIIEDFHAIKEALATKGLEFDRGSLLRRIKNYSLLLVPLLVRSIENAEKLSLAIELRGIRIDRYNRPQLKIELADLIIISILIVFIIIAIAHYWLGVI